MSRPNTKGIGGHFLLSKKARNLTVEHVKHMRDNQIHDLFAALRWGTEGTQVCPECGVVRSHYFFKPRAQWRCCDCGHWFSVTSKTKFANHKIPLRKIVEAIVLYSNAAKGLSAIQLSRALSVAYTTAFLLMHKLRESLLEMQSDEPLEGIVQVDGAHVGGRYRKPRTQKLNSKTPLRNKRPRHAGPRHPLRRIVIVMRELFRGKGRGAKKTRALIVHAEDKSAAALAAKRIKQGSLVMTDELGAYADFKDLFTHKTVNHTFEFSTLSGVNTNQAESYFSRLRRFEFGQIHKLPPTYMLAYVNEIAWREDMRREKATKHMADVLGKALRSGFSSFAGYYQNYLWKRMEATAAAAKAAATAVKPPPLLPAPGGIIGS